MFDDFTQDIPVHLHCFSALQLFFMTASDDDGDDADDMYDVYLVDLMGYIQQHICQIHRNTLCQMIWRGS